MPRSKHRRFSRSKELSSAVLSFGAVTLLASEVAQAFQSVAVDAPNGHPFVELSILDAGEAGELLPENYEARALTDKELGAIQTALSYWGRMLEGGLANSAPAEIYVIATDSPIFNATGDVIGIPDLDNLPLNAYLSQNRGSGKGTALIRIYANSDETEASLYFGSMHTLPQNGEYAHFSAALAHEFAHTLGIMLGHSEGDNAFGSHLSPWEAGLRDIEGESARPNIPVGVNGTSEGFFDLGGYYEGSDFPGMIGESYAGVYFTGEHVEEVLDGALIKFPDASDKFVPGVPVLGFENLYLYDENGNVYTDAAVELSHIELQNGLLSHQNWRNWTTLMEAELAVMQDVGLKIDRKDWFGHSVYALGEAGNPNVVVNTTPFYARNESGTGWLEGVANTNPCGIGLHIYGSYNDVTQAADILSEGSYAMGVRVDGFGNTLRIPASTTIRSDGTEGYGFAVTYGTHHSIVQQGTVAAMGDRGVAAMFSFGDNVCGNANEERGSFLYTSFGYLYDSAAVALNGALVDRYDLSGTLAGGRAAIFIDDNALVRQINVLNGAWLVGDIVSLWDPTLSKLSTGEMPLSELVTDLRFGLAAGEDGTALETADSSFSLYYNGNIHGSTSSESKALLPASIEMSVEGGTLLYEGDASVLSVTVKEGATLAGNGDFTVTALENNANESVGGVFLNEGTLSPGGEGIGSITIRGSFEQAASGILRMEFDSQGKTDKLLLKENAAGFSTLKGEKLDGKLVIAPARDYYSAGTVSFSLMDMIDTDLALPAVEAVDLSTLSPVLSGGATVGENGEVAFAIERQSGAYLTHAATKAGEGVAAAFEKHAGAASGEMRDLVAALDFSNPDGSTLRGAFERLSPDLYGRAGAAAVAAQRTVTTALLSRTSGLIDAEEGASLADGDGRTFVIPLGGYASRSAEGYRSRYAGLAAGVEKASLFGSGKLTFGGHTAVLTRKDKFRASSGSEAESEAFFLGVHGRYDFAAVPGLYGFGYWQGSVENADMTRNVRFEGYADRAEADWTAWGMSLAAGLGQAFKLSENIAFGPVFYLDYSFSHRPDVTESSDHGAALHVEEETYDSLRSSLGVRLEATLPVGAMKTRAAASLWWNHEFMDDYGRTRASFKDWRDTKFDSLAESGSRDTGTAAVSITGFVNERFSTSLGLGADFGDGSHGAWGNVRLDWKF